MEPERQTGCEPHQAETPLDPAGALASTVTIPADGRSEATQRMLGPGQSLGDYEILEFLGRGGMGMVFRARQKSVNRIVALKVIRPDKLNDLSPELQKSALRRFRAEAEAAARLTHDHVVTVYDVGQADGLHFYSMRYVPGRSLADLLRNGPLPGKRVAQCLEPVARAVAAAHEQGILHRDLKPQNILVDETGRPFVTDFGLAKLIDADQAVTLTGMVFGSPPYMPPEQVADSKRVTTRSDVYSLGATLYEALTGRPPFRAASVTETFRQILDHEPAPPRQLNPAIDRDLETVCLKCLEKEPARRYTTAQELAAELARYLEGKPVQARPVSAWGRLWRWTKRNPGLARLAGAVSLVLVLWAVTATSMLLVIQSARQGEQRALKTTRESAKRALRAEQQATEEAKRAKTEATTAKKSSEFLVSLFESSNPLGGVLGLGGLGLRARDDEDVATLTARQILARGAKKVREQLADEPEVQATLMDTIGKVCVTLSLFDEAGPLLEGALAIRRQRLAADDPSVASTAHNLALLRHLEGDWVSAEALLREALAIRRSRFGEDDLATGDTKLFLALLLNDRDRGSQEAKTLARQVLETRIQQFGEAHPHTNSARTVNAVLVNVWHDPQRALSQILQATQLGKDPQLTGVLVRGIYGYARAINLRKERRFSEAFALYEDTIKTARQLFGTGDHIIVAALIAELSAVARETGDFHRAVELANEAIQIFNRLRVRHPKMVRAMRDHANETLAPLGLWKEAAALHGEALSRARKAFGPDHSETLATAVSMANVLAGSGDWQQAEELYRDAINRNRANRRRRRDSFWPVAGLARVLYERADYVESENWCREALAIAPLTAPSEVTRLQTLLAAILRDGGQYSQAKQMAEPIAARAEPTEAQLRAQLETTQKHAAVDHPSIAEPLEALAQSVARQNRWPQAISLEREALRIRENRFGPETAPTTHSMIVLAGMLAKNGDRDEARKLTQSALIYRRKHMGEDHPEVVEALRTIARQALDAGETERAQALLREALGACQKKLPQLHLRTDEVVSDLAELLLNAGRADEAETLIGARLETLAKRLPSGSWRLARLESLRGACLASAGRYDKAEAALTKSLSVLETAFGNRHAYAESARRYLAQIHRVRESANSRD